MSQKKAEYFKFPKGEHCSFEGCGSSKYTLQDGNRYCKRGHRQEGFTQVQADEDDDFKSRTTGRKTRKQRDLEAEKEARGRKVLVGAKALEQYMACLQLVLWKMVRGLEQRLGRDEPPTKGELERLVMAGLWDIRIRAVKALEDAKGGDASSGGESASESVFYSSMSEFESGSEGAMSVSSSRSGRGRLGRRSAKAAPKLQDLLGICYLGCVLMRLPVSLGEMLDWVEKEEIVYLRVVRHIPDEMLSRLPSYFTSALETRAPLRPDELHAIALNLACFFKDGPNMLLMPPLNAPLLMFRHVRSLCLPLDVYTGAKSLAQALNIDFSYQQRSRYQVSMYPEAQIVGLIVIAAKLSHPFDGVTRIPWSPADPTTLTIDWNIWKEAFREQSSEEFKGLNGLNVTGQDVMKMTPIQMGEYLDYFERLFPVERGTKMPEAILEMFPVLNRSPQRSVIEEQLPASTLEEDRLKRIQSTMHYQKSIKLKEDEDTANIPRPGTSYKHYRSVEELPETLRAFYQQAGRCAGLSLETVKQVVFQLEMRLQKLITETKRKQRAEELEARQDEEEVFDSDEGLEDTMQM